MIAVRGMGSSIARALQPLLPRNEEMFAVPRNDWPPIEGVTRYLFCQGLLYDRNRADQSPEEKRESYRVNMLDVVSAAEYVLKNNRNARICVIGSESAFAGSYDGTYAAAKRALHGWVENTRLVHPMQQLVCIAPSIIGDAGMTIRRKDELNLERRKRLHPKKRFLSSLEVAKLVHHVLYVDDGYLTNVTIRMNGGAHTKDPSK